MPPRKKAAGAVEAPITVRASSPVADETSTTLPKRSTRKRKQVNYKEPTGRETHVKDDTPAKRTKRTSTTGATTTVKSKPREKASGKPPGKTTSKAKGKAKAKAKTETQSQAQSPPQPQPAAAASSANRKKVRDDVLEERNDGGEKRKKSWQDEPSEKFLGNMDRALVQPLLFIDRQRCDTLEAPCETFTIAGNSGKDYTVNIRHVPSCSCMDFVIRRIPCKHIIYTMVKVLKVSEASTLLYQLALTSAELQAIFDNAPPAPQVGIIEDEPADPKRKPVDGEECPICYMEFEPGKENITYCKGFCGNNVHKVCMDTWLKSQRSMYGKGTCPYCRQDWVR